DITDSESTRKCFFNFPGLPFGGALQRLDGASVIVMQDSIELIRQASMKVMTDQLPSRSIDIGERIRHTILPLGFSVIAGDNHYWPLGVTHYVFGDAPNKGVL